MPFCVVLGLDRRKTSILKLSVFAQDVWVCVCDNVLKDLEDLTSNQDCFSFVCEPITCSGMFLAFKILTGLQSYSLA